MHKVGITILRLFFENLGNFFYLRSKLILNPKKNYTFDFNHFIYKVTDVKILETKALYKPLT